MDTDTLRSTLGEGLTLSGSAAGGGVAGDSGDKVMWSPAVALGETAGDALASADAAPGALYSHVAALTGVHSLFAVAMRSFGTTVDDDAASLRAAAVLDGGGNPAMQVRRGEEGRGHLHCAHCGVCCVHGALVWSVPYLYTNNSTRPLLSSVSFCLLRLLHLFRSRWTRGGRGRTWFIGR